MVMVSCLDSAQIPECLHSTTDPSVEPLLPVLHLKRLFNGFWTFQGTERGWERSTEPVAPQQPRQGHQTPAVTLSMGCHPCPSLGCGSGC